MPRATHYVPWKSTFREQTGCWVLETRVLVVQIRHDNVVSYREIDTYTCALPKDILCWVG